VTSGPYTPLVSVVIPTYNRSHLLSRSVVSVLNQSFIDFELIIVDDGSIDDTDSVVNSFKDSRIKYIKLETNHGGSHARNVGIRASSGQFIAFQDSDDEWLQGKLKEQVELMALSDDDVGLIYTAFERVDNKKRARVPSLDIKTKEGWVLEEILKHNFVTTQSVLIKRQCFDVCGYFDEKLPRLQDWDLFIRVAMYFKFILIDRVLVVAYLQSDSITLNLSSLIFAYEYILYKYRFIYKKKPFLFSKHCHYLSSYKHNFFDDKRWVLDIYKSILYNPFFLRNYIVYIFGFSRFEKIKLNIKKILQNIHLK
jgi:glycosyltransferase involved in cell wall biosynthesis